MKKLYNKWLVVTFAVTSLLCGGCTTLFQTTVTLTSVVDRAAMEYADIFNKGLVSASLDAKIEDAHLRYRQAAGTAKLALIAYKESGNKNDYTAAFNAARDAASAFIDFIVPMLTKSDSTEIKTNLKKANSI